MRKTVREQIGRTLRLILNPKLFLCVAVAWIITNGWAYILFALGAVFGIGWMTAVGGAYLTFLWFPFTPEKIVTVGLAIWLMTRWFPSDRYTVAVLRLEMSRLRAAASRRRERKRSKKRKGGSERQTLDTEK
jgi:hypothetical protein